MMSKLPHPCFSCTLGVGCCWHLCWRLDRRGRALHDFERRDGRRLRHGSFGDGLVGLDLFRGRRQHGRGRVGDCCDVGGDNLNRHDFCKLRASSPHVWVRIQELWRPCCDTRELGSRRGVAAERLTVRCRGETGRKLAASGIRSGVVLTSADGDKKSATVQVDRCNGTAA